MYNINPSAVCLQFNLSCVWIDSFRPVLKEIFQGLKLVFLQNLQEEIGVNPIK